MPPGATRERSGYGLPRLTTSATFAPEARVLPAPGRCVRTRPLATVFDAFRVIVPSLQWPALTFRFAPATSFPLTFGTTHDGLTTSPAVAPFRTGNTYRPVCCEALRSWIKPAGLESRKARETPEPPSSENVPNPFE